MTQNINNFEKIHQLKISLIEKGWDIEERYSNDGFGKLVSYMIFAKRIDWHGKVTYDITGHAVNFFEICETISDSQEMLNTVQKLHDKCIKAWQDFLNEMPYQNLNGVIRADVMVCPFETAREYHVNDNRYYQ